MAEREKQGDEAPHAITAEGPFDGGLEAAPPAGGMAALREAFPMELLGPATGTHDRDLAVGLLLQVARALNLAEGDAAAGGQSALLAALAAMRAIGPRDGVEGMLAAQMVCAHGAALDFTERALGDGQEIAARAVFMCQAGRQMALFTRQMEALARHRGEGGGGSNGGGPTVGRVNVAPGGQAIVGPVHAGRGG